MKTLNKTCAAKIMRGLYGELRVDFLNFKVHRAYFKSAVENKFQWRLYLFHPLLDELLWKYLLVK